MPALKQHLPQIHPLMLGQHTLLTTGQVQFNQRGLVSAQVGQGPDAPRRVVNAQHPEAVKAAHSLQDAPLAIWLQQLDHTVRAVGPGELAHPAGELALGIDQPVHDLTIVARHFTQRAAASIGLVQIERGTVALVAGHEEPGTAFGPHADHEAAYALRRRQNPRCQSALIGILHKKTGVFVALIVLAEHEMTAVGQPVVITTTSALITYRVRRDRGVGLGSTHSQSRVQPHGLRPQQALAVGRHHKTARALGIGHKGTHRQKGRKLPGHLGCLELRVLWRYGTGSQGTGQRQSAQSARSPDHPLCFHHLGPP